MRVGRKNEFLVFREEVIIWVLGRCLECVGNWSLEVFEFKYGVRVIEMIL